MITSKGLDKKQRELLENMSNQELKQYIDNIVKEYYNCIINKDKVQLKQTIINLNRVKEIFEDKNLDKYITYALINGFNEVLLKSSINDFDMVRLNEPGLNPLKDNIHVRSRLDAVIDNLFYMKVMDKEKEIRESIKSNEDILKLFNYEDYAGQVK